MDYARGRGLRRLTFPISEPLWESGGILPTENFEILACGTAI